MKATQKTKVKFDGIKKMFRCVSVEKTPGHKWFITGEGTTPTEAYKDWRGEVGVFETGCIVMVIRGLAIH